MGKTKFLWIGIAALGILLFAVWFFPHPVTYTLRRSDSEGVLRLQTIGAVPFPITDGAVDIHDTMAHLRIPSDRSVVAKRLTLSMTFMAPDADLLEVGVRRGAFWLDYERVPLRNTILDRLANTSKSGWITLHRGEETLFLPKDTTNSYQSVKAFLENPPTSGPIGLFGNTRSPCDSEHSCTAVPFRLMDDPHVFAAIYARYVPIPEDAGETERTLTFDLTNIYQHSDGSLDIQFFARNRDESVPHVRIARMNVAIQPTWPSIAALTARFRRIARELVYRPQEVTHE